MTRRPAKFAGLERSARITHRRWIVKRTGFTIVAVGIGVWEAVAMDRHRLLALLIGTCVVFGVGCTKQLPWRSDWRMAMAEARHDRLSTLMMFSAAMCPRCWHMDKEVFTDERVREELAGYKLVRLDIFAHSKMAKQYDFTGTPSFVAFSATGRVLATHAGTMDPPTLVRWLQRSRLNR